MYTRVSPIIKEATNKYTPMSEGEVNRLMDGIKRGNIMARNQLVLDCLPLVIRCVNKYTILYDSSNIDINDFIQDGVLEVIRVIEEQASSEADFSNEKLRNYMVVAIKHRVISNKFKGSNDLNFSDRMIWRKAAIKKIRSELIAELNREPTLEEICKKGNFSLTALRGNINNFHLTGSKSIDEMIKLKSGSEIGLSEIIEDKSAVDPEKIVMQQQKKKLINELLAELTDEELKVIRLRYGFSDGKAKSHKEIAKILGISVFHARYVDFKAIAKFRSPRICEKLKDIQIA